jgi:hypothetical protein
MEGDEVIEGVRVGEAVEVLVVVKVTVGSGV